MALGLPRGQGRSPAVAAQVDLFSGCSPLPVCFRAGRRLPWNDYETEGTGGTRRPHGPVGTSAVGGLGLWSGAFHTPPLVEPPVPRLWFLTHLSSSVFLHSGLCGQFTLVSMKVLSPMFIGSISTFHFVVFYSS